jgi:hypothetical protein
MKLKYILIIIGSMTLLGSLMSYRSSSGYRGSGGYSEASIIFAVIGLGLLLLGVFWKK